MEQTVIVGKELMMCIQTAEPYIKPPNYIAIEMSISKLKMEKQLDMINFVQNSIERKKNSSKSLFMNSF